MKKKKIIILSLLTAAVITAGVVLIKKGTGTPKIVPEKEKSFGEELCENCTG